MRPMSRGHNKLAFATPKPINIAALQLAAAMRQENITKGEMAKRLKTSHAQVNRILDPKHNPSLSSLEPRSDNCRAPGECRVNVGVPN